MSVHRHTREELEQVAESVLWWPSTLTFIVLGLTYSLLSDRLTVGPPWLILALAVAAVAVIYVLRWKRLVAARRMVDYLFLSFFCRSPAAAPSVRPTPW